MLVISIGRSSCRYGQYQVMQCVSFVMKNSGKGLYSVRADECVHVVTNIDEEWSLKISSVMPSNSYLTSQIDYTIFNMTNLFTRHTDGPVHIDLDLVCVCVMGTRTYSITITVKKASLVKTSICSDEVCDIL